MNQADVHRTRGDQGRKARQRSWYGTARYHKGILEVSVPVPEGKPEGAVRIAPDGEVEV
jgi:hypothetical protein